MHVTCHRGLWYKHDALGGCRVPTHWSDLSLNGDQDMSSKNLIIRQENTTRKIPIACLDVQINLD